MKQIVKIQYIQDRDRYKKNYREESFENLVA